MSPGLLDSEFTSQHTSSFTPPISFPIVPGLGSSPSPSSGITKHPHVWDLPSNTNGSKPIYYSHEVIPIVIPTLNPVDPEDSANMIPPPNGIVNPYPNSYIRRSSDPTPMSTSHGVALGHYHLLPPIELTGTGSGTSQWPKAKPNGPRPQSRTRTTRPKASFYILDNDNEQDEDRYINNSNQSSTLYHSNSSRKRSIEGYAISHAHAHAHGQEQPMQFRVVNPDRSSSPTLSSTSEHLDDNEAEVQDREGDETRRGNIYLDGGNSEMDEEELRVRLKQYNIITGYNHTPGTGDETDRDIRGRRKSLIDRAKTFMLRRNKDEIGTDHPYNEAGLQNGTILDGEPRPTSRSWLRWREFDSEDRRRAASEDWTRNHMARHERIRQGSSGTANTHPQSSAQQKRMVNPYPKMSFDLGLDPKSKRAMNSKPSTNTNNQMQADPNAVEAWDSGLPPQRPASNGQLLQIRQTHN